MNNQYFIASRWRNRDKILELFHKLESIGKKVYCFITSDPYHSQNDDPEKIMKEFEATPTWQSSEMVKNIYAKDLQGLKNSDALVLLLPAGKSAHIEAGVAFGMDKKCILIGEQKEAESLYLIFDEVYPTIDEFIEKLK